MLFHNWEHVRLGIEHDIGKREQVVRGKEQVNILQGLGLTVERQQGVHIMFKSGKAPTSQKLSMLSRRVGGMALTLSNDV